MRAATTADGSALRLTPAETLVFEPAAPTSEGTVDVFLDPRRAFQTHLGIGGALTDAAAETLAKVAPARQEEVLAAYESTDHGIGYTLARTTSTVVTSRARAIPTSRRGTKT